MALRVFNRTNLHARIVHYAVGCDVVDRYRRVSAGVNNDAVPILQAYGMEPCCPQKRGYHTRSCNADGFTYVTSGITLATGVVLVLGYAGNYHLN